MLEIEIIIKGWLDQEWCEWLGGLKMAHFEPDQTLLNGVLPDQAAVYGIIARLRDLGLQLSSVKIRAIEKCNGQITNEKNGGIK
jgi:hypothetical protein